MKRLPTVILDANVLAQAPIRDTLLRLAEGPTLYRVRWSAQIIAELKRTLESKFAITPARSAHLESQLREYFPDAWIEGFELLTPRMTNHPKDRHVPAAAVHAKTRLVVTYNLRDFPIEITRPWRIVAAGPSTFLLKLYRTDRDLVLDTLRKQSADIRRTLEAQLKVLYQAVPAFVDLICRENALCPTTGSLPISCLRVLARS